MQSEILAVKIVVIVAINVIRQKVSDELASEWRPVLAYLCGLVGGILISA